MTSTDKPYFISHDELLRSSPDIQVLRLRGHESEVYTVEVMIHDRYQVVTDSAGQSLMFRSQLAAKRPFKTLNVKQAILVHTSSYDEMIGQAAKTDANELQVTLRLPVDDYS